MAAKGSTAVLASSEDQDAIRRAAKARRRNQRSTMDLPTSDILSDVKNDRKERRERQQAAAQQRRERQENLLCIRRLQALAAADDPAFVALRSGSVAKKIATGILLNFSEITPAKDQTRTRTAFEEAKKGLTSKELERTGAVHKGYAVARDALNAAYRKVGQQQVQSVPQPRSASE